MAVTVVLGPWVVISYIPRDRWVWSNSRKNLQLPVVGWLVLLRSYVALPVFQSYRDLEAGIINNL